jgi:hypothetical protein
MSEQDRRDIMQYGIGISTVFRHDDMRKERASAKRGTGRSLGRS